MKRELYEEEHERNKIKKNKKDNKRIKK
jgi:hypothetical protein